MRLRPLMTKVHSNKGLTAQARYRNTNSNSQKVSYDRPKNHQYTGNASTDLAYASMYDNQIARDLKLMGLI